MDNQSQVAGSDTAVPAAVTAGVDISRIAIPASITNVKLEPVKFNFRKDKELGTKRPSVELAIPVPTTCDWLSIFNTP